jgi:hypothetical protein
MVRLNATYVYDPVARDGKCISLFLNCIENLLVTRSVRKQELEVGFLAKLHNIINFGLVASDHIGTKKSELKLANCHHNIKAKTTSGRQISAN